MQTKELHVISSLLVCMLINNNIIVLFTETLCRAFDCKYIIFALMSIRACGLQNKSFVVFPQTKQLCQLIHVNKIFCT